MAKNKSWWDAMPFPHRQPEPDPAPAPDPSLYVLTLDDLVAAAREVDPTITPRAIRSWKDDEHILPEPLAVAQEGKRGRPKNRFPAEAAGVVRSLARWRRYVQSTEQAETWLWLEGHDYIKLPTATVFYSGYIAQELIRLQGMIPRLSRVGVAYGRNVPPEENVKFQEETCEEITEDIDLQIVEPLAGDDRKAMEALSVVALCFYLGRLSLHETVEELSQIDSAFDLNKDIREIVNTALTKLLRAPVSLPIPLTDTEIWQLLGSFNLAEVAQKYIAPPRLELPIGFNWRDHLGRWGRITYSPPSTEPINWECVRYLWQLVCQITDARLAEEPKRVETAVDLLVVLRRLAFRNDNTAAIRTVFALNFAQTRVALVRWLECVALDATKTERKGPETDTSAEN
jgi:hypothetical protein